MSYRIFVYQPDGTRVLDQPFGGALGVSQEWADVGRRLGLRLVGTFDHGDVRIEPTEVDELRGELAVLLDAWRSDPLILNGLRPTSAGSIPLLDALTERMKYLTDGMEFLTQHGGWIHIWG